jgi:hypothetical protein
MLTGDQVAREWFGTASDPIACAGRALERLRSGGLIDRRTLEAHPLLPQSGPLLAWKPGMPRPTHDQFQSLADRARGRWPLAHIPLEVYVASKQTCRLFGAFVDAQGARHCETTHDLHLAEVFVLYRLRKPRLASQWLGEGAFPKLGLELRGMKDPDAFLIDSQGAAQRVIEFAGSYEVDHLRAFHNHCSGGAADKLSRQRRERTEGLLSRLYPVEGISYELW